MTKIVDAPEALELLRNAVADRGSDFVYQKKYGSLCDYFINDKPACIVGHVLGQLGLTLDDLGGKQRFTARRLPNFLKPGTVEFTDTALIALGRAQQRQDIGRSWGEAVDAADAIFA